MPDTFDPKTAVIVGRIIAPHGLRGEVKVEPLTDFPERFETGARLWVDAELLVVEATRPVQKLVYIQFVGVQDRNRAESLRGKDLEAPPRPSLSEGSFYQHDVIGLEVREQDGRLLGLVADIFPTGSNDVYVVRGDQGELLLPATDDVIHSVDLQSGVMHVELIDGLEWVSSRPSKKARRETPTV
jgi:16S rRNA processing protein RimM